MNNVIRHIELLLLHRDCVVMPTIGALLAQNVAARVVGDNTGKPRMEAPRRCFCFNGEIIHNDGLLATSIARSLSVSYEKASEIVTRECDTLRMLAVSEGEVPLGKVGILRYNKTAGAFTFREYTSPMPTTFTPWLKDVDATQVLDLAKQADIQKPSLNESAQQHIKQSLALRFTRIAAAVALLIGLGLTLSTPISIDNATLASLSVPQVKKIDTSMLVPEQSHYVNTDLTMAVSTDNRFADTICDYYTRAAYREDLAKRKESALKTATYNNSATSQSDTFTVDENHAYCVIVASLASEADAEKYLAQTPASQSLRLLEVNGKYRVYCATAPTSAEAWRIASSVSTRFPGAWVCHR